MSFDQAATPPATKRIGHLLIDEGLIEAEQLEKALEVQALTGGKTIEILVDLGFVDVTTVSNFLASRPSSAEVPLAPYRVPESLCELIPREFAAEHEVFPIDHRGHALTVAVAAPLEAGVLLELERRTGATVTPLVCNPGDVRGAIARYYPTPEESSSDLYADATSGQIETGIKIENVVAILRRIDSLPALPRTVQLVQEASADLDTSVGDIADIVSMDPAVSAKLLHLANSAAYGFVSKVETVLNAITLLGMRETNLAVLSSAIMDITENAAHFDHESYWKSSMFCAAAARNIAAARGHRRPASVFTIGLLADIGRYALAEVAAARCAQLDGQLQGQGLVIAEEEVFGIGHPEAGHILAVHWRFPEEIAEATRFHHRPELAKMHPDTTAIVALASIMSDAYMREENPSKDTFVGHGALLESLEMDPAKAADLYAATRTPEML